MIIFSHLLLHFKIVIILIFEEIFDFKFVIIVIMREIFDVIFVSKEESKYCEPVVILFPEAC